MGPCRTSSSGVEAPRVRAVNGVSFRMWPQRDPRSGGRERQRKDDPGANDSAPPSAGFRLDSISRARSGQNRRQGPPCSAARDAARVPGSVLLAQPALHRVPDARAKCCGFTGSVPEPDVGGRGRAPSEDGGPFVRHGRATPVRPQRRPAPAGRSGAGARPESEASRARRAGGGARRVDPGTGAEPARVPARPARAHHAVHRARAVGGSPHVDAGRGDVPRRVRRDRHLAGNLRARRATPTRKACCAQCPGWFRSGAGERRF